jgi:hypothetical protein
MSKVKSLGKANDAGVPEVEINAAKLVQNAKSKGLMWCAGHYFLGGNGGAVACCAVGAAHISEDTRGISLSVAVNDQGDSYFTDNYGYSSYNDAEYTALLYREAMQ